MASKKEEYQNKMLLNKIRFDSETSKIVVLPHTNLSSGSNDRVNNANDLKRLISNIKVKY